MSAEGPAGAEGMTEEERAVVDQLFESLETATFYDLLGVPRKADRKTIRDAYFSLSKRFHPDVYFGRELGAYRPRIEELFRAITRAYDVLSNPRQRAGYDLHLQTHFSENPSEPPASSPVGSFGGSSGGVPVASGRSEPSMAPVPMVPGAGSFGRPTPIPVPAPAPGASVSPPRPSSTPLPFQSPPGLRGRGGTPMPFPRPGEGRAQAPRQHNNGEPVVVPAPLRSVPAPPAASVAPPRVAPGGASAVDPAARQRAMEAMARKLGLGPRPKTPDLVIPTAPVPQAAPVDPERAAEERRLRALQVIEQGEERQKIGDLNGALECFRNAEKMNHDDASIRMRIEAVTNLVAIQKVNDCIDQAREAMRKGDAAEAARCWERAWESRKSDASLLYNAAEVLAKHSTDYRRAADFAQRALQQDPKMVRGYVILAEAFIAANLKTSARGAIENLTRLDPHHASLKALREKLGPPSLAEQLGLKR